MTASWWIGCGEQSSTYSKASRRSRVEVYLHAYNDGWETVINLARFLWRYFHVRLDSSLGGKTHHDVYTEIDPCTFRLELTMSDPLNVHFYLTLDGV